MLLIMLLQLQKYVTVNVLRLHKYVTTGVTVVTKICYQCT
jgi:hypothetical protein